MITQAMVDQYFWNENGLWDEKEKEDSLKIKKIIQDRLNIFISVSEAGEFWLWRSKQYDASWLNLEPDDQVVYWFEEFIDPKVEL